MFTLPDFTPRGLRAAGTCLTLLTREFMQANRAKDQAITPPPAGHAALPALIVRPKIGLPPSAWMPNPLDIPEAARRAVTAVDAPKNPWNASFAVALLVFVALLNFSLSLLFDHPAQVAAPELRPRLTVTRSEDAPATLSDTGIYRAPTAPAPQTDGRAPSSYEHYAERVVAP